MWPRWPLELLTFIKVMLASMLVIVRQIWMVEKLLRIALIEKVQD
ncbi:hypothetical protein PI125_g9531 [Phytophthora idaei]|nr:hypothetical protein PI125_g9531 [Phytophthora idaei]KAG3173566.1 hypothetical protein PI126_g780 [Phytophthora idaei]